MTPSLFALLAFAAWTLLLSMSVLTWRLPLILFSGFRFNTFPSGTPHGPDRDWRLNRAHLNALENLPIFAAVVLIGKVSGLATNTFEQLAIVVPCARIAQSTFHVSSNAAVMVAFRFTAFTTQWLAMAAMIVILAR